MNSEFQVLNSRFYLSETWTPDLNCQRDSGFQSPGFQISQSKFLRFRNPIYLTWGYIHCFATTYSFTIITINLEILERSLLGSYFLKLYLDWKHGKINFFGSWINLLKPPLSSPGLLPPAKSAKMESIKKLSNFNFQGALIRTFSSELFHTTLYNLVWKLNFSISWWILS